LISEHSGKPVSFPLIAIAPLGDYSVFEQKLLTLKSMDWAIFISTNAVQNAMPRLLDKLGAIPENLKFAAIGPTTAAELAKFGVRQTLIPQDRFDSEALLALPEMQAIQHQKVMIFRGVGGREVLADMLSARGATVDFAECYQRINPQTDAKVLAELWQNRQLHAVVVTSSEAMRFLLAMAKNDQSNLEYAAWLQDITLCVNHARIAESPQKSGLKVAIAESPGDEAMLQCLIKTLNLKQND
jgi:uroporphyrinogen-III synthase